jgi:hypothetical protein
MGGERQGKPCLQTDRWLKEEGSGALGALLLPPTANGQLLRSPGPGLPASKYYATYVVRSSSILNRCSNAVVPV